MVYGLATLWEPPILGMMQCFLSTQKAPLSILQMTSAIFVASMEAGLVAHMMPGSVDVWSQHECQP